MRTYPEDVEDKVLTYLKAEEWQLNMLKLNPSYVHWGVYEDYMNKKKGWDSRVINENWSEFEFTLDEYNEVVNFYFEVYRERHNCDECEGSGLNKATTQLGEDWYDFTETGRKWNNKITKIEILALMKSGRVADKNGIKKHLNNEDNIWYHWVNGIKIECCAPTEDEIQEPEDINDKHDHDAINRWICVKARAKHLGIYGECKHCDEGVVYTEDRARLALQLWVLHPRKGCSRGVYVKNIESEEIPEVIKYLQEAAERNKNRFDGVINFEYNNRENNIKEILE